MTNHLILFNISIHRASQFRLYAGRNQKNDDDQYAI